MHNLNENAKVVEFLPPQDITSATTTNGVGVDCAELGYDGLAIVQLGAMTGAHTCDVRIQESDTLGSGYADIAGATAVQTDANDDNSIATIAFKRTLRFVRAVVVTAGTVTANVIAISGLIMAKNGGEDLNSNNAA